MDYDIVCRDCGSNQISTSHVQGYWDVAKQEWSYDHYNTTVYCSLCGDDGRSEEIPYVPARWKREQCDFNVGMIVKFEPGMPTYSELKGSDKFPEEMEHVLGVVVEEPEGWGRALGGWGEVRETVPVRLFTGELVEVWPRDLIATGGTNEPE